MQVSRRKIVVLGTGGTIAGTAQAPNDNLGYRAAQLGVADLLSAIPGLNHLAIVTEQVAQIDSKDMSLDIWRQLALRCAHWLDQDDVQGLVIMHGTDTLEETAFFLQTVLAPAKPVVLTCAMRPATSLAPDGPQNLVDAISVASFEGALGVVAVCAGVIHSAYDVAKIHTYRLDAFGSGDAGPIGQVQEGRLVLTRNWPVARTQWSQPAIENIASVIRWPRVEIVTNYVGASGAIVQALQAQGVDGIVAAGTGNGTLNSGLEDSLRQAQAEGVRVVRATRCANGRVLAHSKDVLPDSQGLSPVKARIALMLELFAAGLSESKNGPFGGQRSVGAKLLP